MSKIAENLKLAEQLEECAAKATLNKQYKSARIFAQRAQRYTRLAEEAAVEALERRSQRDRA